MLEYKLFPLFATLGLAAGVWGLMKRYGDPNDRHYAMPVAGAILIVGLEWAYELPAYAYLLGILVAPFLFHRTVRSRLEKACRALPDLPLKDLGVRLVRVQDMSGRHIALWQAREDVPEGAGPAPPIVAGAPGSEQERAVVGPKTMVLALDFIGEVEDEYQVVLWGEAPKHSPAELVAHHEGAVIHPFTQILAGSERLDHFREMESWTAIRAQPRDFAISALDLGAFSQIHELFLLRSEEREIYLHVEGRVIRVGATRAFQAHELPVFLSSGARFIQLMREACLRFAESQAR